MLPVSSEIPLFFFTHTSWEQKITKNLYPPGEAGKGFRGRQHLISYIHKVGFKNMGLCRGYTSFYNKNTMEIAKLYFPSKYFIGPGVLEKGLRECPLLGNKAIILTGKKWAIESGTRDKVADLLRKYGVEVNFLSGISPNPDHTEIDKLAHQVQKISPDFLVALGGGSVMDATKAISLVARTVGKIWDFIVNRPKNIKAYPIVAIPTVAASGSEFDGAAVVNNRALRAKMPIGYQELVPKISIVDPELHTSLSSYQTAIGCVDIFCQFFEPYIMGKGEFPMSEHISLMGMKRVVEICPEVLKNPKNVDLRGELAYLASLSMSGLGRVGRGGKFSMHWLEHVLSGHYPEIPHAQGLASLLVSYTKFFVDRKPDVYKRITKTLVNSDNAADLPDFLDKWLNEIGVAKSLSELGVTTDSIEKMANDVIRYYGWEPGKLVSAPIPMNRNDIVKIYKMAF